MNDKNGGRGDKQPAASSGMENNHSQEQNGRRGSGKTDMELINCTGDCTPDIFPICEGTCSAELEGRNATRPEHSLSDCSGDCTPENFPWCEGSCIATLNSIEMPHEGHGKGDKDEMKDGVFNFSELVDCTGDCTAENFPDCVGTCDKILLGRNETRPGPTLSDCTGACTPENFPWCEGTCVAVIDSSDVFGPHHRDEEEE